MKILVTTLVLFGLLSGGGGCGKKEKKQEPPPQVEVPKKTMKIPMPEIKPLPTVTEKNPKIDIAACDKYLAKFEACKALPSEIRNAIRLAFVTWRKAIAKAASNKEARKQVEFSCKAAARRWEKTLKENKCN